MIRISAGKARRRKASVPALSNNGTRGRWAWNGRRRRGLRPDRLAYREPCRVTLIRPPFNINVEGRIADIQRLPEGVRVVLEAPKAVQSIAQKATPRTITFDYRWLGKRTLQLR